MQCDDCHAWLHQVCALFNVRNNQVRPYKYIGIAKRDRSEGGPPLPPLPSPPLLPCSAAAHLPFSPCFVRRRRRSSTTAPSARSSAARRRTRAPHVPPSRPATSSTTPSPSTSRSGAFPPPFTTPLSPHSPTDSALFVPSCSVHVRLDKCFEELAESEGRVATDAEKNANPIHIRQVLTTDKVQNPPFKTTCPYPTSFLVYTHRAPSQPFPVAMT